MSSTNAGIRIIVLIVRRIRLRRRWSGLVKNARSICDSNQGGGYELLQMRIFDGQSSTVAVLRHDSRYVGGASQSRLPMSTLWQLRRSDRTRESPPRAGRCLMTRSSRIVGWSKVCSVVITVNLGLLAYWLDGWVAVGYVVQGFLICTYAWIFGHMYREYRDELIYKYHLHKALHEWRERR